jgi:hypothetical protein
MDATYANDTITLSDSLFTTADSATIYAKQCGEDFAEVDYTVDSGTSDQDFTPSDLGVAEFCDDVYCFKVEFVTSGTTDIKFAKVFVGCDLITTAVTDLKNGIATTQLLLDALQNLEDCGDCDCEDACDILEMAKDDGSICS